MKAPKRPSLRERRPAPQPGQRRGSRPAALSGPSSGKKWRPSSASSASSTDLIVRSLVPATADEKSRQKSRNSCFQSTRPPETSSSWFSRAAVKVRQRQRLNSNDQLDAVGVLSLDTKNA